MQVKIVLYISGRFNVFVHVDTAAKPLKPMCYDVHELCFSLWDLQ